MRRGLALRPARRPRRGNAAEQRAENDRVAQRRNIVLRDDVDRVRVAAQRERQCHGDAVDHAASRAARDHHRGRDERGRHARRAAELLRRRGRALPHRRRACRRRRFAGFDDGRVRRHDPGDARRRRCAQHPRRFRRPVQHAEQLHRETLRDRRRVADEHAHARTAGIRRSLPRDRPQRRRLPRQQRR